jgi:hypothetical protein
MCASHHFHHCIGAMVVAPTDPIPRESRLLCREGDHCGNMDEDQECSKVPFPNFDDLNIA